MDSISGIAWIGSEDGTGGLCACSRLDEEALLDVILFLGSIDMISLVFLINFFGFYFKSN
jgi:hypothetical protein